jgi:hypothetical protein
MKANIDVEDRKEGELIKAGLDDAPTRAVVKVMGALAPLSDRGKRRVLNFVRDFYEEGSDHPDPYGQENVGA